MYILKVCCHKNQMIKRDVFYLHRFVFNWLTCNFFHNQLRSLTSTASKGSTCGYRKRRNKLEKLRNFETQRYFQNNQFLKSLLIIQFYLSFFQLDLNVTDSSVMSANILLFTLGMLLVISVISIPNTNTLTIEIDIYHAYVSFLIYMLFLY